MNLVTMPKEEKNKTANFANFPLFNHSSVLGDSKTEILVLKSSFQKKYQKNTNTDGMNPENQNRGHAQVTKTVGSIYKPQL